VKELIISAVVVFALLAPFLAYCIGYRRGHASGWLDHYFKTVESDRARRDRRGQFIAIRGNGGRTS
jgi:hypothetical protein